MASHPSINREIHERKSFVVFFKNPCFKTLTSFLVGLPCSLLFIRWRKENEREDKEVVIRLSSMEYDWCFALVVVKGLLQRINRCNREFRQRDGWDFSLPKPRDAGFALVTWSLRCDLESLFSSCTSRRLRSVANVIPSSSYMSCRLRSPESCLALTRLLRGSSRPSRNARMVALVWLS